jgi:hypothetical protein
MAGGLTTTEANRLVDASLRGVAYTLPTGSMMLALATAASTAAAAGTEVVPGGNAYARQALTLGTVTNGQVSNSAAVTYTNMPAATVTYVDVYDSAGTPRRAWWGPLTASKTTVAGDTLSFSVGALVFNLT